ncbi:hypothetical protein [Nitrincola iocasae]|uniref:Uncharacterized protein n=1 Tax=Nitrincola iocasae TaxID=2614693 RepID=A0A5J6LAU0_9GAMM|nr:hypothetical protein [Nitrincola iocasae]QEW05637.1 hypothetical protein F5I99_03555 [Nitrincola iocasae]
MDRELLFQFYDRVIGPNWQTSDPIKLSGWEVVEALWPLNKYFKRYYRNFCTLPYDPAFETQADAAQKRFVFSGNWGVVSIETWRVILERHQQSLNVALLNEAAGYPLMSVPDRLRSEARTGAAILFLLQQMTLPFEVADRSSFEPDVVVPDR